jgi:hypothetical protein
MEIALAFCDRDVASSRNCFWLHVLACAAVVALTRFPNVATAGGLLANGLLANGLLGFASLQLDTDRLVGKLGLDAVHPDHAGRRHAPARPADVKAGFDVVFPNM